MNKIYPLKDNFTPSLVEKLKEFDAQNDCNTISCQNNDVIACLNFIDCHSSYLSMLAQREYAILAQIFSQSAPDFFKDIENYIKEASDTHKALRIAKRRVALFLGIADIRNNMDTMDVCRYLSLFADMATQAALKSLWPNFYRRAKLKNGSADTPFGLFILGLGKLGGYELNYSSDIDLIALYDPLCFESEDSDMLQENCVRLCRKLIQMLDIRDQDGYVFRTDFRLRPDPASTALTMSVNAAEQYYEMHGQNWERSALMKARIIAGDSQVGEAFLRRLTPFLWRKNLDYAAIREIHAVKKRIHDHKGGHKIKQLEGHNIKLGRGGIREIEFFAQAWQLIWGGRNLSLRIRPTLEVLKQLKKQELIQKEVCKELSEAYLFLRHIEHRLQMQMDEQTQTLPLKKEAFEQLSLFCGYESIDNFYHDLSHHLSNVEKHYATLFEDNSEETESYKFNFSSPEIDEETFNQLLELGYNEPKVIDQQIKKWLNGTYRATRSHHAQTLILEMIPNLLLQFSEYKDPQASFLRFDKFLKNINKGVQLLAIIHANPSIFELLMRILNGAPEIGQYLETYPHLLDALLEGELLNPPPSFKAMKKELKQRLKSFSYNKELILEDYLELAARWSQDRRFILSIQALYSNINPKLIFMAYSHIAEATLRFILPPITQDFEKRHGTITQGEFAVVALGRLGSLEMTPTSDLDLIFIYQAQDYMAQSDGARSLGCGQYYGKLGQRIINALTAPTAAGILYEVDMRLRPSGNKGPLAVSFESFKNYQENEAWTWEHMALCRARIVSRRKADLAKKVTGEIQDILSQNRDESKLKADVADMRTKLYKEKPPKNAWDIKYCEGGIFDMEFMVQYQLLNNAHQYPKVLNSNPLMALEQLKDHHLIELGDYELLKEHLNLCQIIQLYQRLSFGKIDLAELFDSQNNEENHILAAILSHSNMASSSALSEAFFSGCQKVRKLYETWFDL
ncbi:MAG: bifunctional [glutamine synthetase] adenylyltransferase/[glutamine synthetase]-adenylyl-L-tyrosine phosphorylase [Alphaproteobacteria bacterium]